MKLKKDNGREGIIGRIGIRPGVPHSPSQYWVRAQGLDGASFLGRLSLVLNSPPPSGFDLSWGQFPKKSSFWWPAETQTLPHLLFPHPSLNPGAHVMVPGKGQRPWKTQHSWGSTPGYVEDRETHHTALRSVPALPCLSCGFIPLPSELHVLCLKHGVVEGWHRVAITMGSGIRFPEFKSLAV